jgi:DNA-damage-inducible protein J
MAGTIQIRIDEQTKSEAASILKEMGLDISTAVKMFLKAVINEKALPFQPRAQSAIDQKENTLKPGITPQKSTNMDWLQHPWHVEGDATPMTRDEMYNRL